MAKAKDAGAKGTAKSTPGKGATAKGSRGHKVPRPAAARPPSARRGEKTAAIAAPSPEDHVDRLRAQWARELPGQNTEPMAIVGRANRVANLMRPHIEGNFAAFGLDRGEFDVIGTLRRSGPPYRLSPTDIYTLLMVSSGGLTHRLDRLEKAGLIRREKSAKDGRSVLVALTPAGIALAEKAFRAHVEKQLGFLEGLDADERTALAGLLRKLILSIEARGGVKALSPVPQ